MKLKKIGTLILAVILICSEQIVAQVTPPNKPDSATKTRVDSTKPVAVDSNAIKKAAIDSFRIAIGIQNGFVLLDTYKLDSLRTYPGVMYTHNFLKKGKASFLQWLLFLLALLLAFLFIRIAFDLAKKSELLRDESYVNDDSSPTSAKLVRMDKSGNPYILIDEKQPSIPSNRKPVNLKPPFSYARVQMLWWTLIILTCYTFFFGITGYLLPLNQTAVLLLGLGGIVLATGRFIDNREIADDAIRLGTRSQDNVQDEDFWRNILSDKKGPSIHRLQAVMFNIIFGVGYVFYFIAQVKNSNYPLVEFDEWQLTLLGVSSATYLVLKTSENNKQAPNQSQTGTPNNNGGGGGGGGAVPTGPNNQAQPSGATLSGPQTDESNSEQHDL
jgi:hypothetical protein